MFFFANRARRELRAASRISNIEIATSDDNEKPEVHEDAEKAR